MKLAELSDAVRARLQKLRYDRIIEKHEGPEKWSWLLQNDGAEFLESDGRHILLPVPSEHHPNITILRCIVGDEGRSLTIFLKDTTYVTDPKWESLMAGFVAICEKMPAEDFYVAIVYHEWFLSAPHRLN